MSYNMTDELFPYARVRCKCGASVEVAPTTCGAAMNIVFAILNCLDLIAKGWSNDGGAWFCRGCMVRRRLVKLVQDDNVTAVSPPTGNHL